MYKLTKLFLTINKWVALAAGILSGIGALVALILSIANGYFDGGIISGLIWCGGGLFGFFYGCPKAIEGFDAAKGRADATTPAIWAIVTGVLGGIMGIPAGIFMFIMRDAHYAEAANAEAPKAEENKAE